MARSLLSLLLLVCCSRLAGAADWTVHTVGGRDYLSMKNVAEFYGLAQVQVLDREVRASSPTRSLRAVKDSQDFYINNLKFILSYPAVEHDGELCISRMDLVKLIEPVMRPSKIKNAEPIETIVLDAGHGGHDSGAMSVYGPEKAYTLDTVLRAKALLQAAGYKVVLTRDGDYFVPLEERARIANQQTHALFISMHFNHGGMGTGVEAYTLAPRGVPSMMADGPSVSDLVECAGNARDAENMALATASHAALIVKTHMTDRGLKRARFVVIRDVKIPGVLLEGGFQSNPYDAKMINSALYRQMLAQAIVEAVSHYRQAVGSPASKRPPDAAAPEVRPPVESVRKDDPPPKPPTPPPAASNPKSRSKTKPSKPAPIDPPKGN